MLKNHTVQDNIVGKCKHLTVIIFSNIINFYFPTTLLISSTQKSYYCVVINKCFIYFRTEHNFPQIKYALDILFQGGCFVYLYPFDTTITIVFFKHNRLLLSPFTFHHICLKVLDILVPDKNLIQVFTCFQSLIWCISLLK